MAPARVRLAASAVVLALACAGGEEPPGAPVAQPEAVAQAAPQPAAPDTAPAATALVRETFGYRGGNRDPFLSPLKGEDVRPLLEDLRLVSVIFDAAYPARSVAVLRDVSDGKRYRLRPGDVAGRLRVSQIRPREVVFIVQEFGFERQETLSLRKREETP